MICKGAELLTQRRLTPTTTMPIIEHSHLVRVRVIRIIRGKKVKIL